MKKPGTDLECIIDKKTEVKAWLQRHHNSFKHGTPVWPKTDNPENNVTTENKLIQLE